MSTEKETTFCTHKGYNTVAPCDDSCFSQHSQSEIIEWEKDLSFRFDTWLKLYPGTPTIGEIEEWLLESLRISDECFSTNDHSKSESIEWKEALDSFIKKWVPGSYAHLSDNDENDGERLRTAIQDAITAAVEAREREISEAVDIVGIDCGCVLGKCKMCASIDFIKSEILSFITTAVAKAGKKAYAEGFEDGCKAH